MSEHRVRRTLTYSCGHTREFRSPYPKMGDTQWCMKCRSEVTVMNGPDYYRIRCTRCVFNRQYGADRNAAVLIIARHLRKHPGHVCKLLNGNKVEMIYGEPLTQSDDGTLFGVTGS